MGRSYARVPIPLVQGQTYSRWKYNQHVKALFELAVHHGAGHQLIVHNKPNMHFWNDKTRCVFCVRTPKQVKQHFIRSVSQAHIQFEDRYSV